MLSQDRESYSQVLRRRRLRARRNRRRRQAARSRRGDNTSFRSGAFGEQGRQVTTLKNKPWRVKMWAVLVLVGGVFLFCNTYLSGCVTIWKLQGEIERLQTNIKAMEKRNQALAAEARYLDSPEFIEQAAREQLGMVRPGEKMLMIVRPEE